MAKVQESCEQYVYSRLGQKQNREIDTLRYMIHEIEYLSKTAMTTRNEAKNLEEQQNLKPGGTVAY